MWSWCQPNSGDSQRDACASGLVPEELHCGLLSSRRRSPSARGAFFSQALLRIFLPLQTPPVAQGPFQALFLGLSSWQDSNLLSRTTRLCRSLVCYQGLFLLRIANLQKPMPQCGTGDDCAPAARLLLLYTPSFLWCFDLCSSCSILHLKFCANLFAFMNQVCVCNVYQRTVCRSLFSPACRHGGLPQSFRLGGKYRLPTKLLHLPGR